MLLIKSAIMTSNFESMDTSNGDGRDGSQSPDVYGRSDEETEETVTMTPRELLTRLHTVSEYITYLVFTLKKVSMQTSSGSTWLN